MPGKVGIVIDVDDQGEVVLQKFEGDAIDSFQRVGRGAKGMGDRVKKESKKAGRAIDHLSDKGSSALMRLSGALSKVGKIAKTGTAIGLAAAGAAGGLAAKSFISAADTAESYRIRLNALLGSVKEGNRMFQTMADFAGKVSFSYEEIMGSATSLAGVMSGGVEEVNKWMPMIADLAAVSGLSIQDTTGQIIRMYSAGASAADMFRERGITNMLGFQAGVQYSAEETKKMLISAFESPTSKFRGASENLAKSWSGLLSMIGDKWFKFRNTVMDAGPFDALKDRLAGVNSYLDRLFESDKFKEWIDRFATSLVSGIQVAEKVVKSLFDYIRERWDSIKEIGTIVAGIGAAIAVLTSPISAVIAITLIAIEVWHRYRDEIKGWAKDAVSKVKDFTKNHSSEIDKVKNGAKAYLNFLIGLFRYVFDVQKRAISSIFGAIKKAFNFVKEPIMKVASIIGTVLKGVGDAISNLFDTLDEQENQEKGGIIGFMANEAERLKGFLGTDYVGAFGEAAEKAFKKGADAAKGLSDAAKVAKKEVEGVAAPEGGGGGGARGPAKLTGSKEAQKFLDTYRDVGKSAIKLLEEQRDAELKMYDENSAYLKQEGLSRTVVEEEWRKRIAKATKESFEKQNASSLAYWISVKDNANSTAEDIEDAWSKINEIIEKGGITIGDAFALGFEQAIAHAETFETVMFSMGENIRDSIKDSMSSAFESVLQDVGSFRDKATTIFQSLTSSIATSIQKTLSEGLATKLSNYITKAVGGNVNALGLVGAGATLLAGSQRAGGLQGSDIGGALGMAAGSFIPGIGTAVGGVAGSLIGSLFNKQKDESKKQTEYLKMIAESSQETNEQLVMVNKNISGLNTRMDELYPLQTSAYFSPGGDLREDMSRELIMANQG